MVDSSSSESEGLREGLPSDMVIVKQMISEEGLNPLFISPDLKNFVIAEDSDNRLVGFGQIRSMGQDWE